MLLEELVLENFGIYKGRHVIKLKPDSVDKPIILFGALNGGGKTTILNALKLALYGKFAECSNRGGLSYPDFLARSVNRNKEKDTPSGVELQFTHRRDGAEEVIRVVRRWKGSSNNTRESVNVLKNGVEDDVIAERWYEYIDEFMPSQISSLFFFDGEKIESLASDDQSSELIRTGLHSLLGLDLVDRLAKDLLLIENRKSTDLVDDESKEQLERLSSELTALNKEKKGIKISLARHKIELDKITNTIDKIRKEYLREGGDLLEQRDALYSEKKAIEERLADSEYTLRELASGDAPLLMIHKLLIETKNQLEKETASKTFKNVKKTISTRDSALIQFIESQQIGVDVIENIQSYLNDDLKNLDMRNKVKTFINVDGSTFNRIDNKVLKELKFQIKQQQTHTIKIHEKLTGIDRKIVGIPDPEALQDFISKLEEAEDSKKRREIEIAVQEVALEKAINKATAVQNSYESKLVINTSKTFENENEYRILDQSKIFRDTLNLFRSKVSIKHLSHLEELIFTSFQQLIRKNDLVTRIEIEPNTYNLILIDKYNAELPSDRLSAGERQLLAISILWGLAKASDRPLPSVIDTPLGRLDSNHRNYLTENYFPYASHQVLLLSTDKEIDKEYYKDLEPFITHRYLISYDEIQNTSYVKPGYFF